MKSDIGMIRLGAQVSLGKGTGEEKKGVAPIEGTEHNKKN